MFKTIHMQILLTFIICMMLLSPNTVSGNEKNAFVLDSATEKLDLYPLIYMIKDRKRNFTIEDVTSEAYQEKFVHADDVEQKGGFFESATWLRFEIGNNSDQKDWLLEFAFPLIYELQIFEKTETGVIQLTNTGAIYPFGEREFNHRNFVFNLDVEPGQSKVYYVLAVGGGDLHPPINIWSKDAFVEKSQLEFLMLGIFYGIIFVMILYNLFLYFSLKIKSYLYYVIVITFTLLGKLSINGFGFQYLWPSYPEWNLIATPFWVSMACIFIVIFTKNFLDVSAYIPSFQKLAYFLIAVNALVIVSLPFSHYVGLSIMLFGAFSTFFTVLTTAIVCLKKGARQARFYIVGWIVFLTGVAITILERAVIIPYSIFTEYAGQGALVIEVVLLSLALADKINIMRQEKEEAERKAQQSQKEALENLKKADVLKDEFLAATSHELRTPLYGMIGVAESLRDGITGEVSVQMKEQLSVIITSGKRLTQLVNGILDFSKLKYDSLTLDLNKVYIQGIVDIVITVSKPLLKNKPVHIIKKMDKNLPPIRADENRLQQILYNLLDNAIKYTESGEVTVSAVTENDEVKLSVSDTGVGISNEELTTIFKPFQQGNTSDGIGIGLSITKQLVELHGGRLTVETQIGKGTTFTVILPVYAKRPNHLVEAAFTVEAIHNLQPNQLDVEVVSSQNRARILVADDEVVNLHVLTNQLVLEGFEVISTLNGEKVFQIVQEQSIDLLILDIMMPNISGYEVCQRLREHYSLMELPILMLTAKNQLYDKVASFEVGANDYLVKPCEKQELLSRVKTLVKVRTLNEELKMLNLRLEEKIQKRTEELTSANDELQQLNNELVAMTASRRQLLANIAHELGTPVTLIHGYLQSLQEGLIVPNDGNYSQLIFDKIKVLNRLINDLFDLSKLEAGRTSLNMKEVKLSKWIEQIYQKCEFGVIQRNRSFNRTELPDLFDTYICAVDEERMDQVFFNLISNAIKNTNKGNGTISVSARLDTERSAVTIKVQDNGFGISSKNLPLIFERFYKGPQDEKHDFPEGTGLGLAIVKEVVQSHNGEIWVNSEINKGTTFHIILPVWLQKR
ncbi:ATP-binding protein [Virgibacillus sp. LDC-1]|uniref:ATP-binding protein n=1 Tax=Virgibacillus sp. LDC-1 TaxID=3039856 RepID=UPI0024DE8829|nr:ATP-binding protein [Virgibacillus sp. LDC-1]